MIARNVAERGHVIVMGLVGERGDSRIGGAGSATLGDDWFT